ncbi:MAG: hypothetical protein UW44_C0007G0029 [Candidatus Collierbacteria bacterium GW2011_GWB2_44_22]|uniref:Uncharacterized protein n=1 Tax=Candidatus Collierbacteria bacterium GW2011_GWB2_44_22 TaxID=1618387 RepID=A0A0G1KVC1_9BACT|nr:MAG: hypothetical protein UW31_C0003G0054 [Candidatus Collierbacteria bacterium GW2011_GWA2_44_13]KKT51854.1 MAG: hypothetical protein UW44_C0007G0029 [Candidatus Collierbacteria bacterium GW2011_GWB2_44_22]KKT61957.1 MAG: hypothetical protein UW56_C0014G0002 [Candidatus Collierbacteria bacterium GW2011_GWD1_44_27]KKT65447.1 MAG: hypothetical protein UW58_C0030G0006 [Candidatus Collierbacteria bacterium GW2011_GWC2_44_30]
MRRLLDYFSNGITSQTLQSVGMEVETQFVTTTGEPISVETSQAILRRLVEGLRGWRISKTKGELITELIEDNGSILSYELGRHNIEFSSAPLTTSSIPFLPRMGLENLYFFAEELGAYPYFAPVLPGSEDLLVIPDERDANWLKLDGRDALSPLARTSSVQFTISVSPNDAINILNGLGSNLDKFLLNYPQDLVWKQYIASSQANYRSDRYGGPLIFANLDNYCELLGRNNVIQGTQLIPLSQVTELDIPLYLRSIWWHFRLKRYGNSLCIEVRPLPRLNDNRFEDQFRQVTNIFKWYGSRKPNYYYGSGWEH